MNIGYLNGIKKKFKYNIGNLHFIAEEGAVRKRKKTEGKLLWLVDFKAVKMCKYVLHCHFICQQDIIWNFNKTLHLRSKLSSADNYKLDISRYS